MDDDVDVAIDYDELSLARVCCRKQVEAEEEVEKAAAEMMEVTKRVLRWNYFQLKSL